MKTRNLSFYFFFFSFLLLFACNKEEEMFIESNENFKVLTEYNFDQFIHQVEINFSQNSDFIEGFVLRSRTNKLTNYDIEKMIAILNFNSEIDVSRLDYLNHKAGVYELLENRMKEFNMQFSNYSENRLPDDECDRLVVIRDEMLKECDNYGVLLKIPCKTSVMIAYWYHWYDKDCHK